MDSAAGMVALHCAVWKKRRELVAALLAAGVDTNLKDINGHTLVWLGAFEGTAGILQLLLDGGGSVNGADYIGQTPVIALVLINFGDAAGRLDALLAHPELNLDLRCEDMIAEEWAIKKRRHELAAAIAA